MKVIAEVEVVNRLLPSANLKSRSRPKRAQLCVGRKHAASSSDKHDVELLVSSQNDRTGTQYKVGSFCLRNYSHSRLSCDTYLVCLDLVC